MAKAAETAGVNFIGAPPLTAAMRLPSMTHLTHPRTAQMPYSTDRAFAQKISLEQMSSIHENKAWRQQAHWKQYSGLNTRELQDAMGQSKIKLKTEAQIFKQQFCVAGKHKVSITFKVGSRIKLIKL